MLVYFTNCDIQSDHVNPGTVYDFPELVHDYGLFEYSPLRIKHLVEWLISTKKTDSSFAFLVQLWNRDNRVKLTVTEDPDHMQHDESGA